MTETIDRDHDGMSKLSATKDASENTIQRVSSTGQF